MSHNLFIRPRRWCNKSVSDANGTAGLADVTDDWGQLLARANAGDARAYSQFLKTITPVLRGIVRARAAGLEDTTREDILQEVLIAVHLKRNTWQDGSPARPWVYAIARYKVVDAYRARGSKIDLPIDDFADELAAVPVADPTEATDMEKVIDLLDPRAAEIVRMIGLRGATTEETGQAMGMTEGAVRVALHRALKALAALRKRHIE
jgi:RNA polymerase sigma-70 factor (ECF subfamily)